MKQLLAFYPPDLVEIIDICYQAEWISVDCVISVYCKILIDFMSTCQ